jgi:hypothetical protein
MGAITLSQAQANLSLWIQADAAVSTGQSYSIGDRSLTRANAKEITEKIRFWRNEAERLEAGSSAPRVFRVVPRDL